MTLLIDAEAVLAAVPPARAVELTADAFRRHRAGEWAMPPKAYIDAPGVGDYRAMPARGSGYACLKWVTSYPGNSSEGLPVVRGALLVSELATGELVAVIDCASVTSLRTGAAAAVSAQALAREGARSVGIVGCGVNGAWAARCLDAVGYGPGICHDLRPGAAATLAAELGWSTGARKDAVAADVVVTVTPGKRPVVFEHELGDGTHVAVLGADAAGKAEVAPAELGRCRVFCDQWEQASTGGELSGPVSRGQLRREDVTDLGAVLDGSAPGRTGAAEITLFDSTGLAIQDLGIAIACLDAARSGAIEAVEISLEA